MSFLVLSSKIKRPDLVVFAPVIPTTLGFLSLNYSITNKENVHVLFYLTYSKKTKILILELYNLQGERIRIALNSFPHPKFCCLLILIPP